MRRAPETVRDISKGRPGAALQRQFPFPFAFPVMASSGHPMTGWLPLMAKSKAKAKVFKVFVFIFIFIFIFDSSRTSYSTASFSLWPFVLSCLFLLLLLLLLLVVYYFRFYFLFASPYTIRATIKNMNQSALLGTHFEIRIRPIPVGPLEALSHSLGTPLGTGHWARGLGLGRPGTLHTPSGWVARELAKEWPRSSANSWAMS